MEGVQGGSKGRSGPFWSLSSWPRLNKRLPPNQIVFLGTWDCPNVRAFESHYLFGAIYESSWRSTSLCHPSVMVSLAASSPTYSMTKIVPVLVHNPLSGSFHVTSSPLWSLRRQSFLRSFAMSYVWLPLTQGRYHDEAEGPFKDAMNSS